MRGRQFAALPFRFDRAGVEVMLITTRRKRRWSVPKGNSIGNEKPHRTAAIEAYEEAGLIGKIGKRPLGRFKHRRQRAKRPLDVTVFPFEVSEQQSKWPEKGQRKAIWLPAVKAARLVRKPKLKRLIARLVDRDFSIEKAARRKSRASRLRIDRQS